MYYEIRGEGVRPTGWFIRHLIGPDLAVRSEHIKAMPAIGEPAQGYEVPRWVGAALAASQRQFEADYEAARVKVQADNDAAWDEGVDRAERIYSYRRVRLAARIEEQETWIREKEHPDRSANAGCFRLGAVSSQRTASAWKACVLSTKPRWRKSSDDSRELRRRSWQLGW